MVQFLKTEPEQNFDFQHIPTDNTQITGLKEN